MTYYDLIRSSLRLIGQLGPGRQPNNSEIADALFVLNSMLDAWSIEHLNIYTIDRAVYPLSGQSSFTIGPGGDFDVPRPVRIESAALMYGATETPMPVLTEQRWTMGGGPAGYGYSGVYSDKAYPLITVYLRPPNLNAEQFVLYTWQVLANVVDENATVAFPPGYGDAIRYNLAVRLAPEWSRESRPDVLDLAIQSKAAIKSFNMQTPEMDGTDGGAISGCSAFNIYTG